MSQATHPTPMIVANPLRTRRTALIIGPLGLVTAALVLVALMLADSPTDTARTSISSQPAARSDGGPNESSIAASVSSVTSAGPSESAIATAIGTRAPAGSIPDESRIGAAVSQAPRVSSDGPDESRTAASIVGH